MKRNRFDDEVLRWLPETTAERRAFDAFVEEASRHRYSVTVGMGRDLAGDGRPGLGAKVRTTRQWSIEWGLPILTGVIGRLVTEINSDDLLALVTPLDGEPSLLDPDGTFLPLRALEVDR